MTNNQDSTKHLGAASRVDAVTLFTGCAHYRVSPTPSHHRYDTSASHTSASCKLKNTVESLCADLNTVAPHGIDHGGSFLPCSIVRQERLALRQSALGQSLLGQPALGQLTPAASSVTSSSTTESKSASAPDDAGTIHPDNFRSVEGVLRCSR